MKSYFGNSKLINLDCYTTDFNKFDIKKVY